MTDHPEIPPAPVTDLPLVDVGPQPPLPQVGGGTEHFGGLQRQTAVVGNPDADPSGGYTRGFREGLRQGILQVLDDLDHRIAPPGVAFGEQLRLFARPQVAPTPREEVPETTTVKSLPVSPEGAYMLGVAELRERFRMRTDELLTNLAHGREPWNG